MELLWLKYFCDAAQTENFSETARRFFVPPSNISQTMRKLERELGAELFDRSCNKLTLSRGGRIYYQRVKAALEELESAKNELSDSAAEISGEISLKVSTNRRIVTDAIETFGEKYPAVTFKIRHESGQTEDFDLIISDLELPADQYEKKALLTERISLALCRDNPLSQAAKLSTSELSGENFISMHEGSSMHRLAKRICGMAGFEPTISIYTDDPFYIRKYVEMGLGVAFVPTFSWKGQFPKEVVLRDVGDIYRTTYLYRPRKRYASRAVRLFEENLFEAVKKDCRSL